MKSSMNFLRVSAYESLWNHQQREAVLTQHTKWGLRGVRESQSSNFLGSACRSALGMTLSHGPGVWRGPWGVSFLPQSIPPWALPGHPCFSPSCCPHSGSSQSGLCPLPDPRASGLPSRASRHAAGQLSLASCCRPPRGHPWETAGTRPDASISEEKPCPLRLLPPSRLVTLCPSWEGTEKAEKCVLDDKSSKMTRPITERPGSAWFTVESN